MIDNEATQLLRGALRDLARYHKRTNRKSDLARYHKRTNRKSSEHDSAERNANVAFRRLAEMANEGRLPGVSSPGRASIDFRIADPG